MRIAQIAPVVERIPPKKYGGTERVIYWLTEELVKRGHDVTLFATGDSITSAKLVSVFPRSMREAKVKDLYGLNEWTLFNMGNAYNMQDQFDIIHDHNTYLSLPVANLARTPTVLTLHGPVTSNQRRMYHNLKKPYLVTISTNQIRGNGLNVIDNVYHGLNLKDFPFSRKDEGYLLFVGRMSMDKGVHYAIEVAQHLNIPLIIAAKLDDIDKKYFYEYVEPLLSDEYVKWVGEVDEQERNKLMSKALCMLHPITFREPFGLTLIEAMACGCPVIAFNRGSMPEVIVNGKTGFVVSDADEMADAVLDIDKIDRAECRRYAVKKFTVEKMTDGYEKVYKKILERQKISKQFLP